MINIAVPLAILKLASRRRIWVVRLLLALPVVVAIPIAVSPAFWSMTPLQLTASAIVGVPFLEYAGSAGRSILNRRWNRFAVRVSLTALATLVIGSGLLWSDMQRMPAIEHYTWSEWYSVVIPGVYSVGALACIMWTARRGLRLIRRPGRRVQGDPDERNKQPLPFRP